MSIDRISRDRYCIGDSIAVWYNPAKNTEYDPTIERIFSVIHLFHDREQMIDYIRTMETERIFLILSGDIDQDLTKSVHDFKQIAAIYILGEAKLFDEEKNLKKFQGNFNSIDNLCQSVRKNKRQTENNQTKVTISKLNYNEIEPAFIYSQLLKDILLELHYNENDKNTFAEFAKSKYLNNKTVQKTIEDFQNDRNYSPIWWYTSESILYPMLNGALRNQDIDVLHKLGFFIRDLHHQLLQLQRSSPFQSSMIVYRGQGLNPNDFKRIQSMPNGIISFHHFLSTSRDENVARIRAESTAGSDELVGILFHMTINPSISDIPFASIDDQSAFGSDEAEVLFSMNTIFRIGQTESLGPNLYQIHLTLINNEDQEMEQLIQYLREEITVQDDPLYRFGQLTLRMQEWTKAKEIYQSKLNNAIENRHTEAIAHSYHQLGYIHYTLNDLDTALKYLQNSLNVLDKHRKMYGSAVADTYSMIGQVLFEQKKDLQIALENMQKALEIRLKECNPEPQTLAKNYTQIGETLLYLQCHDKALDNLNEALEIQLRSLPYYHMDLASTYSTISHVYHDRNKYEEGLSYCEKALEIYKRCLRQNHPSLAAVHTNMANNLGELKRFDEAISHANEAIKISQLYLPSDHKDIKERKRILHALQTTQQYYQNITIDNSQ